MSIKHIKNNVHRNGFDLSNKNAFTAKAGELLPIWTKEALPGDKVKVKLSWFTRTMPLNTAAYTRIREYADFYFVPLHLLYNRIDDTLLMTPNQTSATSVYSPSQDVIHPSVVNENYHPYFLAKEYQAYFDWLQTNKKLNEVGLSRADATNKLIHYLNYGNIGHNELASTQNLKLNPFPILAYQKIYNDYYRNQQWEPANPSCYNCDYAYSLKGKLNVSTLATDNFKGTNMFDLRYSNFHDDLFMGLLPNSQYGDEAFVPINTPVWSPSGDPIAKDKLFARQEILDSIPSDSKNDPVVLSGRVAVSDSDTGLSYTNGTLFKQIADNLNLSVLALRKAKALQKYREIKQSNRLDYGTQVEKHFNTRVPQGRDTLSTYLGGASTTLDISEVVNTNLASASSSANIAGKGMSNGSDTVEFDVKEHGILMCIYHVQPILDYDNTRIDALNLKTDPTQYAIPELDATGMETVSLLQLNNESTVLGNYAQFANDTIPMLGYAPRYYDYKTSIDVVNGDFLKDSGLKSWVSIMDGSYYREKFGTQLSGEERYTGLLDYTFFKVYPQILNPIFFAQVNETNNQDQFIVNAFFESYFVRNLDYNGLPY